MNQKKKCSGNRIMQKSRICIFAPVIIALACAPVFAAPALPDEIKTFIEQRESCEHFLGEEGYDQERKNLLGTQTTKYCAGTDERLAQLRAKYSKNPAASKALKHFDSKLGI